MSRCAFCSTTTFAVVIVSVYLYIPYCALVLYTSLERLDASLLAAAMDLGARPWRVFCCTYSWSPLTLPGIFASFIFVFIPMLGEYVTPTLVGGAQGMMIVNVVVSQFQALRFGVGSAMVFVIAGSHSVSDPCPAPGGEARGDFGGRRLEAKSPAPLWVHGAAVYFFLYLPIAC